MAAAYCALGDRIAKTFNRLFTSLIKIINDEINYN